MCDKLQVAVIVENHPYDVVNFQRMLGSFTDCDCYVQPFDLFAQDEDNKGKYDTVLYYSMNWDCPPQDSPIYKYMENELGNTGQGIILLHHALLSFQKWDIYTEVSGVRLRGADGLFRYTQNQIVKEHILDTGHPITVNIPDFTITDETYIMGEPDEPGNLILITTDNPDSIKNIAWTREYKKSRVFCYASGHDNRAYADNNFRRILHNAILWTAAKL
ncbi:MAG: ThuA domain-containing protein [Defluviitaleaceae bacterium]|nr:ThuA domain-containing protein [Defluviitaleaceae bacterium]MCL2836563.1 ThuA domain-containing protein [Defluviitaleaceae bacterium]